ncbi:MAG: hypothetical protein GY767_02925, partial [Shimia sp.]|nr:hypothetical protein [Shimia sp.]
MKMLYKYPQVAYPYDQLVQENAQRDRHAPEFELIDALRDCFAENRYFDVFIEYAKADQEDILCRISVINRGPEAAPIHVLPHLWYRNTWSWGIAMTGLKSSRLTTRRRTQLTITWANVGGMSMQMGRKVNCFSPKMTPMPNGYWARST